MSRVKIILKRFQSRVLDLYTVFFIFLLGLMGLVDGPEHLSVDTDSLGIFLVIISVYYVVASMIIMISLLVDPAKHLVFATAGQMFAWVFIGCASASTLILYVASLFYAGTPDSFAEFFIWIAIWLTILTISIGHSVHLLKKGGSS